MKRFIVFAVCVLMALPSSVMGTAGCHLRLKSHGTVVVVGYPVIHQMMLRQTATVATDSMVGIAMAVSNAYWSITFKSRPLCGCRGRYYKHK